MARYLAVAALAFLLAAGFSQGGGKEKEKDKDTDLQVKGKLTNDDPKDTERGGPTQMHSVRMKAGKAYSIHMIGMQFAPIVRVQDSKGKNLAEDDGSNDLNARILFNCRADGEYKIVCTSVNAGFGNGGYTLSVKNAGAIQTVSAAHAKLMGKVAPDFAGDFAINGKAGKLSGLKDKVVLLYFWEVRSTGSAAYLPRFAEWSKAYKEKGLMIVGATFYPSDIDQKLGFDAEEGELTTVAKADKKSDQALLKAFAKHHNVDHLLLALPKQAAFDTFDTYSVNGLPQVVLIDRKGVVRLVDVGGEKSSTHVEKELKKVIEESPPTAVEPP
jgi:peroxiredoxin